MARKRDIFKDSDAYSTMLDIFLFLVMISISAVILLPAITGNTQIKTTLEARNQKLSSELLLTLLNGRVENFEYIMAGEQMDAVAGPLNNSSIYIAGKKMIAGKELKHRTFADLAAENAASQWVIYHNGKRTQLNFLMTDYTSSLNSIMDNYLDKQIGERYNYNFTVVWRPFVNVPIGGDVTFGKPVPENTYAESTYITMPYHVNFTRKRVEAIIDSSFNTSFGNLSSTLNEIKKNGTNRTLIEEEISGQIFDSINRTIDEAVIEIVDNSIGPILDEARNTMIEQVGNSLPKGNDSLNREINDIINKTLEEESASIEGTMTLKLTSYLQNVTRQQVHEMAQDEIRAFVTDLVDLYVANAITIEQARNRILTEVFSRISINRAQATLAIWEKKV